MEMVTSSPFLGPSLARSHEARFAFPNRRACSQAIGSGEGVTKVFKYGRGTHGPHSLLHYRVTVAVVVRPSSSTMTKNITWEKD